MYDFYLQIDLSNTKSTKKSTKLIDLQSLSLEESKKDTQNNK
jgi:hypothetical protein